MVYKRTFAALRKQVIADLKSVLPAQTYNISIELSSGLVGISYGHGRDLVCQDKFPVRVIPVGGRKFCTLTDMADYLALQMQQVGGAK